MFKEIKSSKNFQKSLRIFKEFNLRLRTRVGLKKPKNQSGNSESKSPAIIANSKAVILTNSNFYFVAQLIKKQLHLFKIHSEIIFSEPEAGFNSDLHFVIGTQYFERLPNEFAVVLVEQTNLSSFNNDDYLNILHKAKAVFNYSLENIDLLQKKSITFKQMYYLPFYYDSHYVALEENPLEEYDVVFHGDVSDERATKYLNAISKKWKVKVINDLGEKLCKELSKAKVIINILNSSTSVLNTSKIFEYLSLGKLVISESSLDVKSYHNLIDIVEFTGFDNADEMIEKISFWLQNDKARLEKINQNKEKLLQRQDVFSFYFNRFLLSNNVIDYKDFLEKTSHPSIVNNFMCLTLSETISRTRSFAQENRSDVQIFDGLRNNLGWIGCGLSYKYILDLAQKHKLEYLIVCEDDVEFPSDFDSRLTVILDYLKQDLNRWDIFSGFIADVHREMDVINIETYKGAEFVYVDKLMSTVFNIYNKSFFEKLKSWDQHNINKEQNTIDRYIENIGSLKVVTTLPYLVGHKEDLPSSIWNNVQNTDFNNLINKSTVLLQSKIRYYKMMKKVKSFLGK